MTRIALLSVIWGIGAAYIYSAMARLPRVRSTELILSTPSDPPPTLARDTPLLRPTPTQISSMASALLAVFGIIALRKNPSLFPHLSTALHSALLWLRGIEEEAVAFTPHLVVWLLVAIASVYAVIGSLLNVASIEAGILWLPQYTKLSYHAALIPVSKQLYRDLEREGVIRSVRGERALLVVVMLLSILGVIYSDFVPQLTLIALSVLLLAIPLSRSHRKKVTGELRKRFDPAALVLYHRRKMWRDAFAFWCIFPPLAALTVLALPLYVFRDSGVEENRIQQTTFIPWSAVNSVTTKLCKQEGVKEGVTRFEVVFSAQEISLDLAQFGILDGIPQVVRRVIEMTKRKRLPLHCHLDRNSVGSPADRRMELFQSLCGVEPGDILPCSVSSTGPR